MTADGQVVATIVRMVVPMRREYGLALDVHQFMHDKDYAALVLEKARASIDPKLREQAAYIESQLFGPRSAPAQVSPRSAAPSPPPPPAAAAPTRQEAHATEEELRARMLRKYTTGLR